MLFNLWKVHLIMHKIDPSVENIKYYEYYTLSI